MPAISGVLRCVPAQTAGTGQAGGVLLWFAGLSIVVVWAVFRSPALDYRMVALGAVLPVGEVLAGRPFVLHTLVGAVAVLTAVMLVTQRKRLARRRWLGLPIGLFMHLVLGGVWSDPQLFWWPFAGASFAGLDLPELSRGPVLVVAMELAGLVALGWSWRRFGLDDAERRRRFLRSGQLDRALAR